MGAGSSPMLRDVRRQGQVLHGLAGRAGEFLQAGVALAPGPGGRVFACGCGDGLFAAIAASGAAAEAGLDWRPIGPLDLIGEAPRLRPQDRVVAVSMSGNVDRTVEAAAAVARAGVPLLALVNGGGGRLGALCPSVSLGIPDEAPFLCGTASYTGTLAALVLLAGGAGGTPRMAEGLQAVADAAETAIATSEAAIAALPGTTGVRVLASGPDTGTARYGAAKLVELTRLPTWHADLEEFAHSQYWSMPVSDTVVVVATNPLLARYATDTCDALSQLGVETLAIEADTPIPSATWRVRLPAVTPALAPLLGAIPLQVLAHRLATASGLDPDTRQHLKSDEARFRVSRLLTRRSLVGTGQ